MSSTEDNDKGPGNTRYFLYGIGGLLNGGLDAVGGPPEEWIERIEQLHETGSVHGLHLHPVHDDPRQFIERMGEEVLPEL